MERLVKSIFSMGMDTEPSTYEDDCSIFKRNKCRLLRFAFKIFESIFLRTQTDDAGNKHNEYAETLLSQGVSINCYCLIITFLLFAQPCADGVIAVTHVYG
jgi:hypothetical protein